MKNNYYAELIQVAAVALAAAQCRELDSTALGATNEGIRGRILLRGALNDVHEERNRQELKWGTRTGREAPPEFWLLVLLEEVGEFAEEIQAARPTDPGGNDLVSAAIRLGKRAREILEGK